ncbi:C-C motif chemokine 27b [Danio aesculapii]|uniref:C-C motif chemokine 27b n=1 Tax=Danio aesculapii TaxID=1142201 RepID=UPI0024BFD2D4|nr:C-C motif chemokine 27b [Danio aesculapii]
MDLIVLGILLTLSISCAQGVTPRCCVETSKRFPLETLKKVNRYEVQTSSGACAIDALILHVGDVRYCATPKMEQFLQKLMKRMSRMKASAV